MVIAFLSLRKYDKSQKRLDISFSCISKLLRLEKFFFYFNNDIQEINRFL